LVVGGDQTALWSAAQVVWSNSQRAAQELRTILNSSANFQSRIRMLSEHLELPAALAQLDAGDVRAQAALSATQANWHASRRDWPEAEAAFDRLLAADPNRPESWLRVPGLLRVATALVHRHRYREAAALLTGGAKRRSEDGLIYSIANSAQLGLMFTSVDGHVQINRLLPNSPAEKSGLRVGDAIVKVNDTELTSEDSLAAVSKLLSGDIAATLRLAVRRSGSNELEVVELTRQRFISDVLTGEQLHPLRAAIDQLLAEQPLDPLLLELRAELAGQWSDVKSQVADYTAAIEGLEGQGSDEAAADLRRLYTRRGNAHVALQQWSEAASDYARGVTPATTDETLLANQALAVANSILNRNAAPVWTVLKPAEATSENGAALAVQENGAVLVATQDNAASDAIRWQLGSRAPQAIRIETSSRPVSSANREADFSEYQIIAASMAAPSSELRGRFVRLDLPGDNRQFPRYASDQEKKYINLAELQVFQGESNIALGKKATSSSGEGRLAPEGAVDGNTVGNDDGNPYSHTWDIDNPWWEVDLGSEQAIDRMVVWNRSDVSLFPRMNHFRIRVLDRSRRIVFEQVIDQAPTPSREIARPVLLVDAESAPAEGDQPLIVSLPQQTTPLRVRVSTAADLADLRVVEDGELIGVISIGDCVKAVIDEQRHEI
jgi:membrane-associated protease RseP (regulator of RpoE activity)